MVMKLSLVKAIRLRASRADRRTVAAVRLRVDPAELRDDLLESLRASSCLGVKQGSNEIEVHLLNSVSERHDRAVLLACIESSKAAHSNASIEIVSG